MFIDRGIDLHVDTARLIGVGTVERVAAEQLRLHHVLVHRGIVSHVHAAVQRSVADGADCDVFGQVSADGQAVFTGDMVLFVTVSV